MKLETIKTLLSTIIEVTLPEHNLIINSRSILESECNDGIWDITIEIYTTPFPIPDICKTQGKPTIVQRRWNMLSFIQDMDPTISIRFTTMCKLAPTILTDIVDFLTEAQYTTKKNIYLL